MRISWEKQKQKQKQNKANKAQYLLAFNSWGEKSPQMKQNKFHITNENHIMILSDIFFFSSDGCQIRTNFSTKGNLLVLVSGGH